MAFLQTTSRLSFRAVSSTLRTLNTSTVLENTHVDTGDARDKMSELTQELHARITRAATPSEAVMKRQYARGKARRS